MRSLRRFHRFVGRTLLFMIEGPKRPYWLPAALVAFALVLMLWGVASAPLLFWLASVCFIVGSVWWLARLAQYAYVKHLWRHADANRCAICGYDLSGSSSERCSECGTDIRRLKKAIAKSMRDA